MKIEKYTFGVGDRFGHEAVAQLRVFSQLLTEGVEVIPVWNKSNREHTLIGTEPESVLIAVTEAVSSAGWSHPWHIDADHINLNTVDRFIPSADFFTIDVADEIGKQAALSDVDIFLNKHPELIGNLTVSGIDKHFETTRNTISHVLQKYLKAVKSAGNVFRHIKQRKTNGEFIVEISMDETDMPQSPLEFLVILAAIADEQIPIQTIAPKFTGRFNKGVDYVGDLSQFTQEFNDDLAVIKHAVGQYGLPETLKLSVHSGSDKFSLYPIIHQALQRTGAGLHIKTAGTNWLEELIGLCAASAEGLGLTKDIYLEALEKYDDLTAPYATVIDIDKRKLPSVKEIADWSSRDMVEALAHEQSNPRYNMHLRQLLHVSFKLAAKKGATFTDLLKAHSDVIGQHVYENLYRRHAVPLFLGK